jgi:hypothetical protein
VRWSDAPKMMIQPRKRSGHPYLWTAEFPAVMCAASCGRGCTSLETNGGSHQHPPAPGCGELKNRLSELARATYNVHTGAIHWKPQHAGQTWQTLSSAPEGKSVLRDFLILPAPALEIHGASTVAASAAKGGTHLQTPFVHDSVASRVQSSTV